ncbi:pterin 4 alpha carbinolamine dehydratase-domain-containing protein [Podospora australis]|uniref:4a-hydroxytetrahydrobiopterin dehydratase n=1 Tax=Podospora australis TaxID=1536484 RepID=A0AAN6X859_9PEZI|nr:pterin 4 alpha carbinolamine dehydratase-domain-containing protein [Podospora australis]
MRPATRLKPRPPRGLNSLPTRTFTTSPALLSQKQPPEKEFWKTPRHLEGKVPFGRSSLVAPPVPTQEPGKPLPRERKGEPSIGEEAIDSQSACAAIRTSLSEQPLEEVAAAHVAFREQTPPSPPKPRTPRPKSAAEEALEAHLALRAASVESAEEKEVERSENDALHDEIAALTTYGGLWRISKDRIALERHFQFPRFVETWRFMSAVAKHAAKVRHHPEWSNIYTQVFIRLTTHDEQAGITAKDTSFAFECDKLAREHGAFPTLPEHYETTNDSDVHKLAGLTAHPFQRRAPEIKLGRVGSKEKINEGKDREEEQERDEGGGGGLVYKYYV